MEASVGEMDFERILQECYIDTSKAGSFFFPSLFYRPFDPIHREIFNVIDSHDSQLKVIAAPRSIGKTTIANILLPAKRALFHEAQYIVPVSATADLAMQQSENLKYFLTTNPLIEALFGDLRISEEGGKKTFSKKQWVIDVGGREVCVMPRGSGQQVRGQLWRGRRPDLIIVDDFEDVESVRTAEGREKKRNWFYEDLLGSVDLARDDWRILVVGTILHEDCLLQRLLDSPKWDSTVLELCDDNFVSNAPHVKTDEECRELYNFFKEEDQVGSFFREYRNIATPTGEDSAFQPRFFRSYREADLKLDEDPNVENVLLIDVAKTANPKSAESAILQVGINMKSQTWYVRDIVHGRFHPDELLAEIVRMAQKPNISVLGVEVTSLHEFITYPILNELSRNKLHHVELIELHARGGGDEKGKAKRVRSLISFYRDGMIWHNEAVCAPLEQQLLSFPRSKLWDIMDALGYMPEILQRGQRFMMYEMAEASGESLESMLEVEREYAELEGLYNSPLNGFRMI